MTVETGTRAPSPHQYSLASAIFLHLAPGAAMTAFVLIAVHFGMEPIIALFLGIGVVIVPLELGILLAVAKRRTGSWSLGPILPYNERMPWRNYLKRGFPLYVWFIVLFIISVAFLDDWVAENLFAWLPDSILQFSTLGGEDDETISSGALIAFAVMAIALNGFAGPIVEELYFRGHLLPAIDRYGRWAPVMSAVLFSAYHFWTPWANPGRILGLLPWMHTIWRTRSYMLSIIIHVSVNLTFLILLIAALATNLE